MANCGLSVGLALQPFILYLVSYIGYLVEDVYRDNLPRNPQARAGFANRRIPLLGYTNALYDVLEADSLEPNEWKESGTLDETMEFLSPSRGLSWNYIFPLACTSKD